VNRLRPVADPNGWFAEARAEHVTFIHWRVPASAVSRRLPPGLELDTFHGDAYVTVAPRRVAQLRLRPFPPMWWSSPFAEVALHTYVRRRGVRGVWYFSLDAPAQIECWIGRHAFHLPYTAADVALGVSGDATTCTSVRHDGVTFSATTRAVGRPEPAPTQTLTAFLHERYSRFVREPDGGFARGDVAHPPWQLERADVDVEARGLFDAAHLDVPPALPLAWYARSVEHRTWPLVRVS